MSSLKTIANILLVNLDYPGIGAEIVRQGYNPIFLPDLNSAMAIDKVYALLLIQERYFLDNEGVIVDHLGELENSAPIIILVDDPNRSDKRLLSILAKGMFDWISAAEIEAGLLGVRINKLHITSTLNKTIKNMQKDFREKERLKKEITMRDSVLDHERELNANIISSITSGLVVIDLQGAIIMLNENARSLLKLSGTDYLGSPYAKVLRGKIRGVVDDFMKRMSFDADLREIKKIGIGATVHELSLYTMRDSRQEISGALLLINDISEQENITQQLYRAEKLATMGTMVSGIAHELRNPLSIISARAQMAIVKKNADTDWIVKNNESIETQAFRCATIINNLLDFARYRATQLSLHKVDSVLDETLAFVAYQKSFDSITIEKKYEPGLVIYGDRSRFVQAFLNIFLNAADAMKGSGVLIIKSRQDGLGWVIVEISDNGVGIDNKLKNRIFDPFFTTKEPGKGTGLGLALVHKIIHESGGDVWFSSVPAATTFFVKLPTAKKNHA
jgi:signal transduction histidine kinase